MNPDDALDLAYAERDRIACLDLAGAPRAFGWRVELDRAKRRLGLTRYDDQVVSLSRHLIVLNPQSAVLETIRHEWAHAVVGEGVGHGPTWRHVAIVVGASPTRLAHDVVAPPARYRAWCTRCQQVLPGGRHRTSAALRRPTWTHTGRCRGPLLWIDTHNNARAALDGTPLPPDAQAAPTTLDHPANVDIDRQVAS